EMVRALEDIRERTEGPFGVNFLIAPASDGYPDVAGGQAFLDRFRSELDLPDGSADLTLPPDDVSEKLDLALEFGVPMVSFALGDPGEMIERIHRAGAKAVVTVTTA